jgi:ribose 5-phosphate isomerase RpiB
VLATAWLKPTDAGTSTAGTTPWPTVAHAHANAITTDTDATRAITTCAAGA